jgi:hypothetical protein
MKRRGWNRLGEAIVPEAWTDPWPEGHPNHRELVALWIDIAKALGYRVSCVNDSRGEHWGADSGWPDLFLARAGRAYAIEVKTPGYPTVTDEQMTWLGELDAIPGVTAAVFRTSGDKARDMGVISDILRQSPPALPRVPRGTEAHL